MGLHFLYILTITCLSSNGVRHTFGEQNQAVAGNLPTYNSTENGDGQGATKGDVPTAEQILGKLLGMKTKNADQTQYAQPAQIVQTAPQTFTMPAGAQLTTSLARSPLKSQLPQTIINNLPLVPTTSSRGLATPQTEPDNQGTLLEQPSPRYGRRRRRPSRRRYDDEDEDGDDDRGDERYDDYDDRHPADEEYRDYGNGHRRWRRRGRFGRREGGCGCVCWKGIKPHVEWVRVPVCYHPCGVCCPKHDDQPACACICHPQCCHNCCCCHHCCHCCHPCCHCCHCCCRRNQVRWNPPLAPSRSRSPKIHKQIKKIKKKAKKA